MLNLVPFADLYPLAWKAALGRRLPAGADSSAPKMLSPKEHLVDTTSPLPGLEAPNIAPEKHPRLRRSHIFPRHAGDHYVEESWCSRRLFDVEPFEGAIVDPACGWGTVVTNALLAGHVAAGFDLVDRGWDSTRTPQDFLTCTDEFDNIVTNPPFDIIEAFITHAVSCSRRKTAAIFPVARLPAAHWLRALPLKRIRLMSPRPNMPPGDYIRAGGKVGGGRVDFCWLIFQRGYTDAPELAWLHRDGVAS